MKLKICIPTFTINEQKYILEILLTDFLGLNFDVFEYEKEHVEIHFPNNSTLTLDCSFFKIIHTDWLKTKSMPILPLKKWSPANDDLTVDLIEPSVPVIYGNSGLIKNKNHWYLNLDIFGSTFFMLSRYEELITEDRDEHGRFPAWASIAYKANFLDRPIVNEYLEILWSCLSSLCPQLVRKKYIASNFITCDVDYPFDSPLYSINRLFFRTVRLIFKEKQFKLTLRYWAEYFKLKLGIKVFDNRLETIRWIMDVNEEAKNKVAFYFIPYKTSFLDTPERITSKKTRYLLKEIYNRGHEIGIHPGFKTYNHHANFSKSIQIFFDVLKQENIKQPIVGGRQHYLKWNNSQTPQLWNNHSLNYDSTLGYADKSGFRCGTSHEYKMYDLITRQPLKLKQRPLIIMDATLFGKKYENLTTEEVFKKSIILKKRAKKYGGIFVLLWHNIGYLSKQQKHLYLSIIKK